ncbi:Transcription factor [Sesamum alatum]|uniref:Transcription factor n=1 Tax=Sesamum alatum TaxID=300844 RepID=A0AAE2CN14_9LAMI|nr:Transcription factor [Sesamum alatum]
MAMETLSSGDHSSKKNKGKVPKRIHKAEREKMKRDHLNELFLALANSLDLSDQNNGKASVLIETTRMVKDMLAQIDCLKKENAALLSESQYVTVEKNELRDENSALEVQIGKLRTELKSRVSELQLDLNAVPPEYQSQEPASHSSDGPLVFPPTQPGQPQAQIVNPLHLAAFCSNVQAYPEFSNQGIASRHMSVVSKPHARYPTPADKWPSQVLEKHPEFGKRAEHGHRNSVLTARDDLLADGKSRNSTVKVGAGWLHHFVAVEAYLDDPARLQVAIIVGVLEEAAHEVDIRGELLPDILVDLLERKYVEEPRRREVIQRDLRKAEDFASQRDVH